MEIAKGLVMDVGLIKQAMKETCREYRKQTIIGKRLPLTILRVIWRQAFLDGATFMAKQTSEIVSKSKSLTSETHNHE